ncbi:MAG: EAL domain-containing protein [Solirubrobacterales bacterium]|nr:EAL domain-containing protein [Solirubrobacterales bacterium]
MPDASRRPRARTILGKLHRLGVRLAIDDYGTGNASLAYFRRLPIDALKIDRSFVMRMLDSSADAAIVSSTIELAHSLGLQVVAEGVESAECNARLAGLDCNLVQGYFYGRAKPAEQIVDIRTRFDLHKGPRVSTGTQGTRNDDRRQVLGTCGRWAPSRSTPLPYATRGVPRVPPVPRSGLVERGFSRVRRSRSC